MIEPKKKARKERFFGSKGKALVVLAVVAGSLIWARASYTPPEAEKVRAENERFRAKRAADVAKADRDRSLCRTAAICRRFGEARQACAAAGDLNGCIRVKVGEKDMDATSRCTNDGRVADEPSDMPNRVQCAEYDLGG